jgi:hypothetical protein
MKKQRNFKIMVLSFLFLWTGLHLAALADEPTTDKPDFIDEPSLTIDENDIHRPIFVVTLNNKGFPKVEGKPAIYRIFVVEDKDSQIIEESDNPVLNLWTDEQGSKRVHP